jgi:hypothetical protein
MDRGDRRVRVRKNARRCARVAAALALLAAPAATAGDPGPVPADGVGDGSAAAQAQARTSIVPRELVAVARRRFGGEFAREVKATDAGEPDRRAAALKWLDEALAPLADPRCAPVLRAAHLAAPAVLTPTKAVLGSQRPVAAPALKPEVLVPPSLQPLSADEVEKFRTTGLLPFEIALSGEIARAIGAEHAGPAPADGVLRLSRAARLEGTARLAGIIMELRGAGLDPTDLGIGLLAADKDEAGLPRTLSAAVPDDAVRRALVTTYYDDGLRWALYHHLRGGLSEVVAALERPGVGPDVLLRPGLSRARPGVPDGCRLGPRAAVALLTGYDDPPWLDTLVTDSSVADPKAGLVVTLGFEDERSASRAQLDLQGQGYAPRRDGTVVRCSPKLTGPRGGPSS